MAIWPAKVVTPSSQGGSGQAVDQPAHCDLLHPGADDGQRLAAEEQAVVAVAERAQRVFEVHRAAANRRGCSVQVPSLASCSSHLPGWREAVETFLFLGDHQGWRAWRRNFRIGEFALRLGDFGFQFCDFLRQPLALGRDVDFDLSASAGNRRRWIPGHPPAGSSATTMTSDSRASATRYGEGPRHVQGLPAPAAAPSAPGETFISPRSVRQA
jgi:hypothetical protein